MTQVSENAAMGFNHRAPVHSSLTGPRLLDGSRSEFDLAMVGTAVVLPDGQILRANDAMCTTLGRTIDDVRSSCFAALAVPGYRDDVRDALRQVAAGGVPGSQLEAQFDCPDRSARWLLLAVSPIIDSTGTISTLLCQTWDISGPRRAEQELRRTHQRLCAALDATTDVVYLKDVTGRYVIMNRGGAAIVGRTADAFVGRRAEDIFAPACAETIRQVDLRVLASGDTTTVEETIPTPAGVRIFQSTKGVYLNDDGEAAGLFGISRDITEERRAEDERHSFQQALELTVEGIARLDGDGRFVWVNDALARLCGYTPSEMVGMSWVAVAHPDDREAIIASQAGMADGARVESEVRPVRRDGSWFHAQLVAVTAHDADGSPSGYYCTLRDITDRKLAEEALRRSAAELERRNGELESFALLAAHDLRQPLQVVGGFAQTLCARYAGQLDERADGYLGAIGRGVDTMTAMVESLLEFAQTGQVEPPEGLTDTTQVVAEVVDGLDTVVAGGQVVVVGSPLPVLPAHPAELTRLFQNLIANGLKFRGEEPPRVEVAAERAGDNWIFHVSDNGMGIDPGFAPQIFGMLQRERRGDHPGTGMGLAICRKIVEHHGGRIWFDSVPGQGSTFSFSLPAETRQV